MRLSALPSNIEELGRINPLEDRPHEDAFFGAVGALKTACSRVALLVVIHSEGRAGGSMKLLVTVFLLHSYACLDAEVLLVTVSPATGTADSFPAAQGVPRIWHEAGSSVLVPRVSPGESSAIIGSNPLRRGLGNPVHSVSGGQICLARLMMSSSSFSFSSTVITLALAVA